MGSQCKMCAHLENPLKGGGCDAKMGQFFMERTGNGCILTLRRIRWQMFNENLGIKRLKGSSSPDRDCKKLYLEANRSRV